MKNYAFGFIKDYIYVLLGILCVVIVGIVYISTRGQTSRVIQADNVIYEAAPQRETSPPLVVDDPAIIVVHIVGEVMNPGVFELTEGARVDDVLQMAGGKTENADLTRINLAALLRDAMQVIVPAIGDDIYEVFIFDETYSVQTNGPVNINTATVMELQTLPGIGPVLAANIVDFREINGAFSSVDELINVALIGQTTLDRLRGLVTVE